LDGWIGCMDGLDGWDGMEGWMDGWTDGVKHEENRLIEAQSN